MPKTFIILGPNDEDGEGVPMHWDREFWVWVTCGQGNLADRFTEAEMFAFPPGELPVGAHTIACLETGQQLTPFPLAGGYAESENNI